METPCWNAVEERGGGQQNYSSLRVRPPVNSWGSNAPAMDNAMSWLIAVEEDNMIASEFMTDREHRYLFSTFPNASLLGIEFLLPPSGSRLSCYQEKCATAIESVDSKDLWVKKASWLINSKQRIPSFSILLSLPLLECVIFVSFLTCRVTTLPLCKQISCSALQSRIFQFFTGDFPSPVVEGGSVSRKKKKSRHAISCQLEMVSRMLLFVRKNKSTAGYIRFWTAARIGRKTPFSFVRNKITKFVRESRNCIRVGVLHVPPSF